MAQVIAPRRRSLTLTAAEFALLRDAVNAAERSGERLHTGWWALTGAPGSGKTTLVDEFNAMRWPTVEDGGRAEMARAAAAANPRESAAAYLEFQKRVLSRGQSALAALDPAGPAVFDYGFADALAFMKIDGIPWTALFVAAAAAVKFAQVFLIEPLAAQIDAPVDRLRIHSPAECSALNDLMSALYETLGQAPIRVPAMPVRARLERILGFQHRATAVDLLHRIGSLDQRKS